MKWLKYKIFISILIMAFVLTPVLALAQTDSVDSAEETVTAQDLGVSEPTILPDSPFYGLKNLWRNVSLAVTFDKVQKAEKQLKYANERVIEAQKLSEERQDEKSAQVLERTIERYGKDMERVQEIVATIKENADGDIRVDKLVDKIGDFELKRRIVLNNISNKVPENVVEKIIEAKKKSAQTLGKVLEQTISKEKITEKIDEILQNQQGSDFKDIKHLEFLKALRQDVPDDVKEKLKEVEGRVINRFEEKAQDLNAQARDRLGEYIENASGEEPFRLEVLQDIRTKAQVSGAIRNVIQGVETKVRERFEANFENTNNEELRDKILERANDNRQEERKVIIEDTREEKKDAFEQKREEERQLFEQRSEEQKNSEEDSNVKLEAPIKDQLQYRLDAKRENNKPKEIKTGTGELTGETK